MIYYVSSIVCVLFDLLAILLLLVFFMYPEFHRGLVLYTNTLQVGGASQGWEPGRFQYYDHNHAYTYHIAYNTVLFVGIFLLFGHILASGAALFGVKLKNPFLMLPQLVLLTARLGVLVVLCFGLTLINFVGNQLVLLSTLLAFVFSLVTG